MGRRPARGATRRRHQRRESRPPQRPDVERELEEVARRVRALADSGVPLTSIAIVARQARPYLDLALTALEKFGVPATARRRYGLREIPVVRAVRTLFAAAADGWSRHALVELAEQPYLASDLDAQMLNFVGFTRRVSGLSEWSKALHALALEAEAQEQRPDPDDGDRRRSLPHSARLRAAATGFDAFAEGARELDRARPLSAWLEWLDRFLTQDPWKVQQRIMAVPGERFDMVRVDLRGWRELKRLVTDWKKALDTWGGAADRLDAGDFFRQLDDLLDGDAVLHTPMQRGVQVMEALAAAYRSFDHVFIVGLEGGRFPLRQPASPVLDEGERIALSRNGLSFEPREVWDARERELFHVIVAGARKSVTLSWSSVDAAGREVVRSAFVETLAERSGLDPDKHTFEVPGHEVTTAGARLYDGADAPAQALHAFHIEAEREGGVLSPHNGLVADPALLAHLAQELGDNRLWSPTQLESYAKCPWSWFSRRLLRLDRLEDPDEDMDPATRGTLAHDALHRFFDAAVARTGGPVLLRQDDLGWALPLMEQSVDAAFAGAANSWLGHRSLQSAKRSELRRMLTRYIEAEIEQNEKMFKTNTNNAYMLRTGVESHELAFAEVVLERNGVRFRYRGTIDRVEVGIDERVPSGGYVAAVDYKSSRYAAPGGGYKDKAAPWADRVVLQIPLYAHALTVLRPGAVVSRVEYRELRKGERVHPLDLVQVNRKTKELMPGDEAAEKLKNALDAVAAHVLDARAGHFAARSRRVVRVSIVLPRAGDLPDQRRPPGGEEVLMDRPNPRQWEAIRNADRHVLVAASAGTGKTSTVVNRILYLLGAPIEGETYASPVTLRDIGAITYTNAAAADLKAKLRFALRAAGMRDVAYEVDGSRIGTIHSFCGDVLREFALRSSRSPVSTVLEEGESAALAYEVVRETVVAALDEGSIEGLEELFSVHKVSQVEEWMERLVGDADRLQRIAGRAGELGGRERALIELASRALVRLHERLDESGAVDFDRMIVLTRDLLRDSLPVRRALQRRLRTLIVDEFQDVDPVQKEIAWLLGDPASRSPDTTRLMLVGDPKQSIYRFRRADVTVWSDVERAFTEGDLGLVVGLEENFRSVEPILAFVDAAIGPIMDKPVDEMEHQPFEARFASVTAVEKKRHVTDGPRVEIIVVPNKDDDKAPNADEVRKREAAQVATRMRELNKAGTSWKDMAVLLASWSDLDCYEEALRAEGIPTYALRVEGFFERREVLDLILALETVRDPRDDRALMGFLRSPFVGLRDETLLQIAIGGRQPYWESLETVATGEQELLARGVRLLREHIALRDRLPTHELIESLIQRSGYLAFLVLQGNDGKQAIANIRKLARMARQVADGSVGEFLRISKEIRARGDRVGDERLFGQQDDVVTITSVHSAKGLEWDVVFWCDLIRGAQGHRGDLIVGRDAIAIKDPDEEEQPEPWPTLLAEENLESHAERKRLWYVAATRAKERLILSGVTLGKCDPKTASGAIREALGDIPASAETIRYTGQGGKSFEARVTCCEPLPVEIAALEEPRPPRAPIGRAAGAALVARRAGRSPPPLRHRADGVRPLRAPALVPVHRGAHRAGGGAGGRGLREGDHARAHRARCAGASGRGVGARRAAGGGHPAA